MEANQEFTATTLERLRRLWRVVPLDPEPYRAMWSRREPVSLFGALGPCKAGWPEVEATFRRMAAWFSDGDMTTTSRWWRWAPSWPTPSAANTARSPSTATGNR